MLESEQIGNLLVLDLILCIITGWWYRIHANRMRILEHRRLTNEIHLELERIFSDIELNHPLQLPPGKRLRVF